MEEWNYHYGREIRGSRSGGGMVGAVLMKETHMVRQQTVVEMENSSDLRQ